MDPTSNELTKQIIQYLTIRKCFVWRNNSRKVRIEGGRFMEFGKIGSGDIIGVDRSGKFLSIEVKVGKDKERPEQEKFRMEVLARGGLAIVARSLEDVARVL